MTRRCVDCGRAYYAAESWKVRCLDCWSRRKDAGEKRTGHGRGFAEGFSAGLVAAAGPPELGAEFLRELVLLTHPDRHPPERFQQANAATARLIELLDKQRRAA